MKTVWSTVIRSVRVPVRFDDSKVEDDAYLDKKQSEILKKAAKELDCPVEELIIHDSDHFGLID